ncbi:MAG: DUF4349 domain-containing protein [Planctomycetota bacterium]
MAETDWRDGVTRNDNSTAFETADASPALYAVADADGDAVADSNFQWQAAPVPEAQSNAAARQVIYTGRLTVLSPDPNAAIERVRQLAEDHGGYADFVRRQQVQIRVPAGKFDATIQAIGELGLVTDRAIDAVDVTAQMFDLEIRLDNLEAMRVRMKALLDKAEKVEDMLAIEKELGRIVGEIEQLKGQLRLMKDRVALSTITVNFNRPAGTDSGLAGRVRPFPWVNSVGSEAFGAARLPNAQPKLGKAPKLTLPDGFVRFYQQGYRVFAIDRGQVVIKVTRQANYDAAGADFWADQVRDRLTKELGVPVGEPAPVQLNDQDTAFTLTGDRQSGTAPLGYFVGLAANDKNVFLVEAWGPAEEVEAQRDALITALKTLRVNRGWW